MVSATVNAARSIGGTSAPYVIPEMVNAVATGVATGASSMMMTNQSATQPTNSVNNLTYGGGNQSLQAFISPSTDTSWNKTLGGCGFAGCVNYSSGGSKGTVSRIK